MTVAAFIISIVALILAFYAVVNVVRMARDRRA